MLGALAKKVFGSVNDRRIKSYRKRVAAINALEPELQALSDEALAARTGMLKAELAAGKSLDDILVPAFATVREASRRILGQRHFDVQLMGGMVLHEGDIAEMRTGEGKTLVGTLPVYLNALTGKGVHVVTVNDYLARRDAETMAPIYSFLGLSVGVIVSGLNDLQRKISYSCDITYGTNTEYGFDFLRDNMKYDVNQMVQRGHNYAIIDEVDSILIDEARTPLIISGPSDDRSELYVGVDALIPRLSKSHYVVDLKQRTVLLTDEGDERMHQMLTEAGLITEGDLFDAHNAPVVHHVQQALRAHVLYQKDKEYIVRNGEVVIIDEGTGRMMVGRRYSEGLHQAIEAKEGVQIQPENQTMASITYQNYFRMYGKLSGMSGTAATEVDEFSDIYKLSVVEVPTNRPVARVDENDEIYLTAAEKYAAIIQEIGRAHARRQPVLVGTGSIEHSEVIARLLAQAGYVQVDFGDADAVQRYYDDVRAGRAAKRFAVLNARFHEQEAHIIAEAGLPGAITIATNMAGRGTDIKLGGSLEMRVARELAGVEGAEREERLAAIKAEIEANREFVLRSGEKADPQAPGSADFPGGLYIIGTERHESRRIDNQLRGRAGRQGDPGRSRFYLSLEDDLIRAFGSDRLAGMLQGLGHKAGDAIVHPWISKAVEKAQRKIEQRNYEVRKNVLKYDDVVNDQRKAVFEQRNEILGDQSIREDVAHMRADVVEDMVAKYVPEKSYPEQWDAAGLKDSVARVLNIALPVDEWAAEEGIADAELKERILQAADQAYAERRERNGQEAMDYVERQVALQALDHLWRNHIEFLDHLKQVVGMRAVAQQDPFNEFRTEAFAAFQSLRRDLDLQVTANLMRVQMVVPATQEEAPPPSEEQDLAPADGGEAAA